MTDSMDLGAGVSVRWVSWDPDLDLNPQYADMADQLPIERAGLIIMHPRADTPQVLHESAIMFDLPVLRSVDPHRPRWHVDQWEPLTLSPSILCSPQGGGCGLHGFIREGRWVAA